MTADLLITFGVLLGAIVRSVWEKPADLVAFIVMTVLTATGVLTVQEGISGFANEAIITAGCMFVLSASFVRTGVAQVVSRVLSVLARRSFMLALFFTMLTICTLSAFINNTAEVAILMPIALAVARDTRTSPSKWLMPLSYASVLGGLCKLIGSSTNILVSSKRPAPLR